jgi:hypothetical protein
MTPTGGAVSRHGCLLVSFRSSPGVSMIRSFASHAVRLGFVVARASAP